MSVCVTESSCVPIWPVTGGVKQKRAKGSLGKRREEEEGEGYMRKVTAGKEDYRVIVKMSLGDEHCG